MFVKFLIILKKWCNKMKYIIDSRKWTLIDLTLYNFHRSWCESIDFLLSQVFCQDSFHWVDKSGPWKSIGSTVYKLLILGYLLKLNTKYNRHLNMFTMLSNNSYLFNYYWTTFFTYTMYILNKRAWLILDHRWLRIYS